MDWSDPELNPFGLKLFDDARKSVSVIVTAKALAHFKDAAGDIFVCVSIGGEKKVFKAGPSGYEEAKDEGIGFVVRHMTDEFLNKRR